MALSNTTKKVLVWSTVAVILGVGGYFGYKWYKRRKDEKKSAENPPNTDVSSDGSSGGENTNSATPSENPFKSEAEIKAFQDWLDKTHPFWIKDTDGKYKNLRTGTTAEPNRHIGGKGYGSFGENTKKAYALFGSEYMANKGSQTTTAETKLDAETERAVNVILGKGYGSKINRSYLVKQSPSFLKSWAWNFNNDKTAFSFNQNVYRTKTGEVLLNYDPIGIKHKTNGSVYAYYYPTLKSDRTAVNNVKAGRTRAIQFNEGDLWLYFPDNGGNYKWARAKDMKIDY